MPAPKQTGFRPGTWRHCCARRSSQDAATLSCGTRSVVASLRTSSCISMGANMPICPPQGPGVVRCSAVQCGADAFSRGQPPHVGRPVAGKFVVTRGGNTKLGHQQLVRIGVDDRTGMPCGRGDTLRPADGGLRHGQEKGGAAPPPSMGQAPACWWRPTGVENLPESKGTNDPQRAPSKVGQGVAKLQCPPWPRPVKARRCGLAGSCRCIRPTHKMIHVRPSDAYTVRCKKFPRICRHQGHY